MTNEKVDEAAVEAIIERVGRENSIDGMDGDSWDRLLVRAALSAHGLPVVDANLIADLKRCLDDVATEMRARGRDDSRFTQLSARLPAITGGAK